MKRHLALLSFLLTGIIGGNQYGSSAAPSATSATVHFNVTSRGVPIVSLKLTDKVSANFVIATDNDGTYITPQLMSRLKLKPQTVKRDKKLIEVAVVPHMEIGNSNMTFADTPFFVRDLSHFNGADKEIDGILGANLLTAIAISFNPQKRLVTFWNHGNLSTDEVRAAGFSKAAVAKLTITPGDYRYSVKAHFKNGSHSHDANLLVDTNSIFSQVTHSDAVAIGAPIKPSRYVGVNVIYSEKVTLGTLTISNHGFSIAPKHSNYSALGLSTLGQYRFLIDCPAGKMYFIPIPSPGQRQITSALHSGVQTART